MRLRQGLDWNAREVDRMKLVLFDANNCTAPPFNSGAWRVGWSRVDDREGPDALILRWDGVDPAAASGELEGPLMGTPSKIQLSLELELLDPSVPVPLPAATINGHFAALMAGPTVFDVLLSFPRNGQELWTNERTLRRSPYFDNLLSSGFSEAVNESSKTSPQSEEIADATFVDSDAEADTRQPKRRKASHLPPHKTVCITEASYTTYLAVVCWLQSGHNDFATLSSSSTPSSATLAEAASAVAITYSSSTLSSTVLRLLPVSPKSVYRLAHLLKLPQLVSLALANFRSQLSIDNVINELFTETAACYDELGTTALDFTMANLKNVEATEAYKEIAERAEAGGLEDWESRMWAKFAVRVVKELVKEK